MRRRLFALAALASACTPAVTAPAPHPSPLPTSHGAAQPSDAPYALDREGDAVSSDGTSIHWRSYGGDAKTAVVFVHCWGCSAHYWDEPVRAVAPHARVVTLDLAGHGRSGRARKAWTVEAFADDVGAVVTALALEKVVLVGHSMGGAVVVETARRMGHDKLLGVVAVDTLKAVAKPMPEDKRAALFGAMRADFRGTTEKIVRSLFPKDADPKVVDRVLADELAQDPAIAVPMLENAFAYPAGERARGVEAPVHGLESDLSPTDVEGNRTDVAQFEWTPLAGVGHWPMLESPARFSALLDDVVWSLVDPTRIEDYAKAADGVAIHYRGYGPAASTKHPVVFVSGWCGSTHWWDHAMRRFAKDRRVVAIDLGGQGLSGRKRDAWSIPTFAGDVRAVVERLGLEKPILVGHSLAGDTVVEAARTLPVAGVVPIDELQNVDQSMDPKQKEQALAAFRADFPGAVKGAAKYFFVKESDPKVVARVLDEMSVAPPSVAIPILEAVWNNHPADALREVKAPIIAIMGDTEPVKLEVERKYAPQFDAVHVAGVGHYPMLEAPDAFDAALADVLAKMD